MGLFGEYVREGEQVWAGGLAALLQQLDFSPAAARIALNRLVTRGMLHTTREGKFATYSIAPPLAAVLEAGRRRTFAPLPTTWDGSWTIVWYAMPKDFQRKRARLSRWLGFWGFRALQDGTWAAPGDRAAEVRSLLTDSGLSDQVFVMNSVLSDSAQANAFARRMWNLDDLKQAYDALSETFGAKLAECSAQPITDAEAFDVRTRAIEMFRKTVVEDPRLPDYIVGQGWKRSETYETFAALQSHLKQAAQRHFASATQRPVIRAAR